MASPLCRAFATCLLVAPLLVAGSAQAQRPTAGVSAAARQRTSLDSTAVVRGLAERAVQGDSASAWRLSRLITEKRASTRVMRAAVPVLTPASDSGSMQASYLLGLMYESGVGVAANSSPAVFHFANAAELGHPDAMYRLGRYFKRGIVVIQSDAKAQELWKSAADLGHVAARDEVTRAQNAEAAKDIARAAELLTTRAADQRTLAAGVVRLDFGALDSQRAADETMATLSEIAPDDNLSPFRAPDGWLEVGNSTGMGRLWYASIPATRSAPGRGSRTRSFWLFHRPPEPQNGATARTVDERYTVEVDCRTAALRPVRTVETVIDDDGRKAVRENADDTGTGRFTAPKSVLLKRIATLACE